MTDQEERDWILSLPLETKIRMMETMLDKNELGYYLAFIQILLDAPISQGGVSTEILDKVFDKWMDKPKQR